MEFLKKCKTLLDSNLTKVLSVLLIYSINFFAYFLPKYNTVAFVFVVLILLLCFAYYDFKCSFIIFSTVLITALFNSVNYPLAYTTTVCTLFAGVFSLKHIYDVFTKKTKFNFQIIIVCACLFLLSFFRFDSENYKNIFANLIFLIIVYLCFVNAQKIDLNKTILCFSYGFLTILFISLIFVFVPQYKHYVIHEGYRFMSFFGNPNALQVIIVMTLSLLILMFYKSKISLFKFLTLSLPLVISGVFTKSKAFLLLFCLLILAFIVLMFIKNKKMGFITLGVCGCGAIVGFIIFKDIFIDILSRFTVHNYDNLLDKLLTGRVSIWKQYLNVWSQSVWTILFGVGVTAPPVVEIGAHSSYVEFLYAYGIFGILLVGLLIAVLIYHSKNKKNFQLVNLLPLLIFLLLSAEESLLNLRCAFLWVLSCMFLFYGDNNAVKLNLDKKTNREKDKSDVVTNEENFSITKCKVLVWGMTDNPGGVESVIMNFYRHIDKSKVEFVFLHTYNEIAYEDEIKQNGDTILKITPRRENYLKYTEELENIFSNNAYDCVWANCCSLSNIDVLKFAKKYGVKKRIIHAHNSKNMGSKITYALHLFNKLLIGKVATHFWSCSKVASEYFYNKTLLSSKNYKIINNAIDTTKFKFSEKERRNLRKELNINKEDFVVGHVGRFHEQKNHEFLIDVFNEILKQNKTSKLVLVGIGEKQELIQQKVKELNIENNVLFLGSRNDIPKLLSVMDIFLFPSLFEGLSVSLVEAQASGLTIFTSTNVISDTKLTDNYYSLSLNDDALSWANFIIKTYNSNIVREQGCKDVAQKGFDIKLESEQLLEEFYK